MMGHDEAALWDTFEAQEKLQRRVARLERELRSLVEVCPKCGGTGEFQDFPAHDESPADALIRCPECHGTGVVPTETFERLVGIVLARKGVILPWEV